MIVLTLVDSPPSLRGDLTKWLQEISPGVYVGQVSTRVRDELWERVKGSIKKGRATLVYSTNNEQRMDFRVHNTSWEPIDFDGLKLLLRPNAARITKKTLPCDRTSTAGDIHTARKMARRIILRRPLPERYCVVSVEVTDAFGGEPILCGIQAITINRQDVEERLHFTIVSTETENSPLPPPLPDCMWPSRQDRVDVCVALSTLQEFVGDRPIVSHHEEFLFTQLRSASAKCSLQPFTNFCFNTFHFARLLVEDADDYTLEGLLSHLQLVDAQRQEKTDECLATKLLYEKLIKISTIENQ